MKERVVCGPGQKLDGQFDEVFVLAGSRDEAAFVDSRLNSAEAAKLKAIRMGHLRQNGEVDEVFMPDTESAIGAALWRRREEERARKAYAEREKAETETKVVEVDCVDLKVDGLEVCLKNGREGFIKLDGQKVGGVQSLKVELSLDHNPRVTMELLPVRPARANGSG